MKNEPNHAVKYAHGMQFDNHHWITESGTTSCTPHRILCVDDEIEGTRMRGQILEEEGYSAVLYHSPLEALDCDLSMFSLAIFDFEMPEMNGRELLLRARALGARFPIVLLTGSLDSLSNEDRVLFARCIDKGMPLQYLLETITEFLSPDRIPDFGT